MDLHEIAKQHYYHLHQYPELSNQEYLTTAYVKNHLEKIGGYELDLRANTGLVATINPGCATTIAFRADIDALPITEKTNLEYASKHDGVMHACGHDFHTANLLAFAQYLSTQNLNITVKLIFQANEETTPGGSIVHIENGILNDVDHFFGLHVDPSYAYNEVLLKSGPLFASIDDFCVTLSGEGGHISTPNLVRDPFMCAVSMVNGLMAAVHKRIDPMNQPLIGISSFNYGQESFNIINNETVFRGTIRCHNHLTRTLSIKFLKNYFENTAKAFEIDFNIEWFYGEPPLVNDPDLVATLQEQLSLLMPKRIKKLEEANFGGEDFSNYASLKPSAFFIVGCHSNDADFHNDHFQVNLDAFETSLELFSNLLKIFNKREK